MDKFKAYQQQMEKALKAFEYTTEWADLVNALGKVNKVLSNHPQFSKIPCDTILGRRLAQCLHPGLPNGVLLKALETYDLLFKAIGTSNLMQELSKFSNGLFPLLSYADLNVKPALLDLYETHFLPLNEKLKPALDGFLIATLHGLEETNEFYHRTDSLLMEVCAGVGSEIFYASLWRCILTDQSVRLQGMNFLISHFNKKKPLEDQLYILGTSTETLINAICVSLLDTKNVLVQRAALDLLLRCFPLHNEQIKPYDMITIATGAVTVLLRRDMSLNRRLLAWLFNMDSGGGKKSSSLALMYSNLGSSATGSSSNTSTITSSEQKERDRRVLYFETYGKSLVIEAFRNCLSGHSKLIDIPNIWSNLGDFWNYRLMICLIDHTEICELIINDLCLDILRSLCRDFNLYENERPEFIRTVRLLLNSMNISYIWSMICSLLVKVCEERRETLQNSQSTTSQNQTFENDDNCVIIVKPVGSGPTNILELCAAYDFVMICFPIEIYHEIARGFFPKILYNLLTLVIDYCPILNKQEYMAFIRVISSVFEGLGLIHKDGDFIKSTELTTPTARNNLATPPSPLDIEEEENEEVYEQPLTTNDSSQTNTDDTADEKSLTDQNNSTYLPLDFAYDKNEVPSIDGLIELYQQFFHCFVIKRLLKIEKDTLVETMKVFGEKLKASAYDPIRNDSITVKVDAKMENVYQALCQLMLFVSRITLADDDCSSTDSYSNPQANLSLNNTREQYRCKNFNPKDEASSASQQVSVRNEVRQIDLSIGYGACSSYVYDLMFLSERADSTIVCSASIGLVVEMLTISRLNMDPDFANDNRAIDVSTPTFSEELNASIVQDSVKTSVDNSRIRIMLTREESNFILKESCWFSLIVERLWKQFGSDANESIKTVNLIQSVHNLTYNSKVCEDIICKSLNNDDEQEAYVARKRFILLFNLMRTGRSSRLKHREFERPLLFMLDSLSHKMEPFNCLSQDWLAQVFKFRSTSRVLEQVLLMLLNPDTAKVSVTQTKVQLSSTHHSHMLLYFQIYDSGKILYALSTLWNIINTEPHHGLIRMANSSMKGCHELQELHIRHCNALAGRDFHSEMAIDHRANFPSFLEIIVSTCINFLCGYYMQTPQLKLSNQDIKSNQKVRILASEILRHILSNLFEAVKGCPTHPIHDLLNRCRTQELVLHCLVTSVKCSQQATTNTNNILQQVSSDLKSIKSEVNMITTDNLIDFNDGPIDSNRFRDDFQRTLLRLTEDLITLEHQVAPANVFNDNDCPTGSARIRYQPDLSSDNLKYLQNILISSQTLFLAAVQSALQQLHCSDLHMNWLTLIETTIPISGRSLTRLAVCVVTQLCCNMRVISKCIVGNKLPKDINLLITPKYLTSLMAGLMHMTSTHDCLIDTLTRLSSIIDTLLILWKAMVFLETEPTAKCWTILGEPADVKKQILALLSPISLRHGKYFMSAMSIVWLEIRNRVPLSAELSLTKEVVPSTTKDQLLLVQIVASISELPMEAVFQTTKQVIKNPPPDQQQDIISNGLLQFFLAYIRLFPGSQLIECWKPLLQLLREGLQLELPLAHFNLLAILHEIVHTAPLIEDRKDQKDLQDVTQKLIDSFITVIGARLGQTRWLRRALEVEPAPQELASDDNNSSGTTIASNVNSNSVQALNYLAEFVAPVLDVVFPSDEKDKILPLVGNIMSYITPYLKNHKQHNSPSFLACSHLLSSISGYQYTRKAWRKEALELLLDPSFFQMDRKCMEHWRLIVDHLMVHDFREFLTRMSLTQSRSALQMFVSRDQESEQRAQLIKRMAFIIFCSERDQYQKYIPEIQEKLIESLRMNQSDLVQAQIMLCFRVLIIRSSAHFLTSLWPYVYTEMFQGLLEIESYIEQCADKAPASLTETSFNSARFLFFLYTCKLLDTVLALPADSLPQFQMYRWSFVGDGEGFEPHLVRIARKLSEFDSSPAALQWFRHYPVLTLNKISNLLELYPFFHSMTIVTNEFQSPGAPPQEDPEKYIDWLVEGDFLEE